MAVAPASMAEKIIVLDDEDDDKEENPQTSCVTSSPSSEQKDKNVSPLRAQQSPPTHITQSPFASAKKQKHVLEAENQTLFTEVSLTVYPHARLAGYLTIYVSLLLVFGQSPC